MIFKFYLQIFSWLNSILIFLRHLKRCELAFHLLPKISFSIKRLMIISKTSLRRSNYNISKFKIKFSELTISFYLIYYILELFESRNIFIWFHTFFLNKIFYFLGFFYPRNNLFIVPVAVNLWESILFKNCLSFAFLFFLLLLLYIVWLNIKWFKYAIMVAFSLIREQFQSF